MNDDVDDERVWTQGWPEQVLGTRQPTPAEEAYGKTLIPLAEEALAASGKLPTASQAPSQGGLPPYTPAASGGALSAEQVLSRLDDWLLQHSACVDDERHEFYTVAKELLATHDQKVREQVLEEVDKRICLLPRHGEANNPVIYLYGALTAVRSMV